MQDSAARLAEAVRRAAATGPSPFVIAIGGGVAAGKSTLARALAAALATSVEVVGADGFLLPNAALEARGLMARKGFPETFDAAGLARFFADVRGGVARLTVPTYAHAAYDVVGARTFDRPDILIFEGVNALAQPFDYGVYVEADEANLEDWYVSRFLALRRHEAPRLAGRLAEVGGDPAALARSIWREVNLPNLRLHIAPTRRRADAVVRKRADHALESISFRPGR